MNRMGALGALRQWPAEVTSARLLHETALRLYPDGKYAKEHGTEAPTKRAKN
jgi:hypothetical protein